MTLVKEPIPGYELLDRLGAGGYGEVWRASAPGGLNKAIKIVFGVVGEKRADGELKALERVKMVRHPFLLSLERIEIVESQLVIVMELADASVHCRLNECLAAGQAGIPRAELMGYMRDTADALDYMSREHGLQHLDIKPENLLLLAGHIKVADFGLVQDFQRVSTSLLGGLTPQYAAPEVFHGRPSQHSDQYSLAMLYAELLTGYLPFDGESAAELTRQHLLEDPDLSNVPPGDREILTKALAKRPEERYGCCMELVRALEGAKDKPLENTADSGENSSNNSWLATKSRAETNSDARPTERVSSKTQVLSHDVVAECQAAQEQESLRLELPVDASVVDLPPLEINDELATAQSPCLIVGVGGVSAIVLRQLREQIARRYGDAKNIPSIQMLLLDTDPESLHYASHGNKRAALANHEVMHLPLRKPQEYRNSSKNLLSWIGRRWLYNIPKSLRTEGLRPLGRLALVDHCSRTVQRIKKAAAEAMSEESIAQSTAATGMEFKNDLRIYIVASASGGTGGGMAIDLGFIAQNVLEKLNLPASNVNAFITHSTSRSTQARELANVSTFAFLSELNHFQQLSTTFPGDKTCGLLPRNDDRPPFENTYFISLGSDLDETQLNEQAAALADYLYVDLVSPAASYFEQSRSSDETKEPSTLRTMHFQRVSCVTPALVENTASTGCKQLIRGWIGEASDGMGPQQSNSITPDIIEERRGIWHQRAQEFMSKLDCTLKRLSEDVRKIVDARLESTAADFHDGMIDESLAKHNSLGSNRLIAQQVFTDQGSIFSCNAAGLQETDDYPKIFGQSLEASIKQEATALSNEIRDWVIQQVDDPQVRLYGSMQIIELLNSCFLGLENAIAVANRATTREIAELIQKVTNSENEKGKKLKEPSLDDVKAMARKQFLGVYNLVTFHGVSRLVACVTASLSVIKEQLYELRRDLKQLLGKFSQDPARLLDIEEDGEHPFDDIWKFTARILKNKDKEMEETLGALAQATLFAEKGLYQTVLESACGGCNLHEQLFSLAKRSVLQIVDDIDAVSLILQQVETTAELKENFESYIESQTPDMLKFGGRLRQLIGLPVSSFENEQSELFEKLLGASATLMPTVDRDVVVCSEADGIPLPHVAVDLIDSRPDYAQLAERLYSRQDIDWTSF